MSVEAWPGLLVVIEGIDGAGKSTLARGLADRAEGSGHEVVRTREPTDGPFGRRIRALAASERSRVPADEEWRLFHEDRRIHVEELVRPSLAAGKVVIQDRSWPSTVAYQGERGLDRAMLEASERRIAPDPDVLLVVDLPPTPRSPGSRPREGGPTTSRASTPCGVSAASSWSSPGRWCSTVSCPQRR